MSAVGLNNFGLHFIILNIFAYLIIYSFYELDALNIFSGTIAQHNPFSGKISNYFKMNLISYISPFPP